MKLFSAGPPMWVVCILMLVLLSVLIILGTINTVAGLVALGIGALAIVPGSRLQNRGRLGCLYPEDLTLRLEANRQMVWAHLFSAFAAISSAAFLAFLVLGFVRPEIGVQMGFVYYSPQIIFFAATAILFGAYIILEVKKLPFDWKTPAWGSVYPPTDGFGGMSFEERRSRIKLVWDSDHPDRIMRVSEV